MPATVGADGNNSEPGVGLEFSEVACLGSEAGLIPRAVSTMLADAHLRRKLGWEFVLTATYVEIYNEKIRDLLNPASDNLKVIVYSIILQYSRDSYFRQRVVTLRLAPREDTPPHLRLTKIHGKIVFRRKLL